MIHTRWMRLGAAIAAAMPVVAMAQAADPKRWQLNMGRGVTPMAHNAYDTHMWAFWVCVVIGVIVFGAMFYAMFAFRKSKGAVAAKFTHNVTAEIIWTTIPVIILVALTIPTIHNLVKIYDTSQSAMTVKITGYQWMWKYDYIGSDVSLTSRLARSSDELRQSGKVPSHANDPHYLLDVDHPLVLPINTKVRFIITADDVIHSWWVPAFGLKQDAIPGIANESWAKIDTPGFYRGQCAELCGKDHGFMPIVVKAVTEAEFKTWMFEQQAKAEGGSAPAAPAAAPAPAEAPAPTAAAPAATLAAATAKAG